MWASQDRRMELVLEENGKIRVTLDGKRQPLAASTNAKKTLHPYPSSHAWNRALEELLHHAIGYDETEGRHEILIACQAGILQIIEWASEFCAIFEVCFGRSSDVLMENLAKRTETFLGAAVSANDSRVFTDFFLGTALLRGLLGCNYLETWSFRFQHVFTSSTLAQSLPTW